LALLLNNQRILYAAVTNVADVVYVHSDILPDSESTRSLAESLNLMQSALRWRADHQPGKRRLIGLALLKSGDHDGGLAQLQSASAAGDIQADFDLATWYVAQHDWASAAHHLHRADPTLRVLINRFMDQLTGETPRAIALGSEYANPGAVSQVYYRLANHIGRR
jgi:hypothetical protein